jgi:sugar O-acyltransferase (sialic acid O-acetyltransferase NeuD family)
VWCAHNCSGRQNCWVQLQRKWLVFEKMIKQVVIIGAGGLGREALDILEACNQDKTTYEMLGYIVDQKYGSPGTMINGESILGDFHWLEEKYKQVHVICAVGLPYDRFHLVRRAVQIGCKFINLIHPNSILTHRVFLAEGIIIAAGSILTNQIRIGNHVLINMGCTIGHDAIIEDFVTLAPGVHVSGNVSIKEGCSVGTGANIIEKKEIGEWSVVGAGSTIISNIPANTTAVGVPAKVIKTREPGWQLSYDQD